MADSDWTDKLAGGDLKSTILPMSRPFASAMLFLAAFCLFGALSIIPTSPVEGWLASVLMTFFVVTYLIMLFTKRAYLELSREGLAMVFLARRKIIRWENIKEVRAEFIGVELPIEFNKSVRLGFLNKKGRMRYLRLFARAYKLSADELASLIAFYRDRAR
jgi:hypothetical protein